MVFSMIKKSIRNAVDDALWTTTVVVGDCYSLIEIVSERFGKDRVEERYLSYYKKLESLKVMKSKDFDSWYSNYKEVNREGTLLEKGEMPEWYLKISLKLAVEDSGDVYLQTAWQDTENQHALKRKALRKAGKELADDEFFLLDTFLEHVRLKYVSINPDSNVSIKRNGNVSKKGGKNAKRLLLMEKDVDEMNMEELKQVLTFKMAEKGGTAGKSTGSGRKFYCWAYQDDKCTMGSSCKFLHEKATGEELKALKAKRKDAYATTVCKNCEKTGHRTKDCKQAKDGGNDKGTRKGGKLKPKKGKGGGKATVRYTSAEEKYDPQPEEDSSEEDSETE